MNQKYDYQNFISMPSFESNSHITNTALRDINFSNNNNHSRMPIVNIKYPDMQLSRHVAYEGLDSNIINYNSSSIDNYDEVQYTNVKDINSNNFLSNDYDNATAPYPKTQNSINQHPPLSSHKISYINSLGNGPIPVDMNSKFDRSVSIKTNAFSSSQNASQISPARAQHSINSYNGAKFESIRKTCLSSKILYQDPDFPPNEKILYPSRKVNFPITWLRPSEIVSLYNQNHGKNLRPELVGRGFNICDLNQGSLGDCWVVAALACLTCHDLERNNLLCKLIPPGQSFRPGMYFGAFLFRFWRNGDWYEVIIDDLLPTNDGKLIFIGSNQPNEFWGSLVEKAYAKLNGSYEALDAGQLADVLDDFTGGMTEYYSLDQTVNDPNKGLLANLDDKLIRAYERHSLITAGILNKQSSGSRHNSNGIFLQIGLVAGHPYVITDIRKIKLSDNKMQSIVTLLRLRNPWGSETEWNGPWSEKSREWLSISDSDKKSVGLIKKSEGEFWICMTDFLNNFDTIEICHLSLNQNARGIKMKSHWNCLSFCGEWKIGISAGGRPKLANSHFTNPQFRIQLKDPTDNDCCPVIIGLLQEDPRRSSQNVSDSGNLSIGFVIYQLKSKDTSVSLRKEFFTSNTFIASVDSFINSREVVKRFQLSCGTYLIVPCTYDANQEGRFLLRIFMESVYNSGCQIIGNNPVTNQMELKIEHQKQMLIRQMFYRESGSEMSLTSFQFQRLINWFLKDSGFKYELNIEACKAIVVLFDESTGKPQSTYKFFEKHFMNMWGWLLQCLEQISSVDYIGPVTLQRSLENLHLSVSSENMKNLIHRFCNESASISVSGFITIVAIISKTSESFDFLQRNNSVSLTRDEYLSVATKI